MEDNWREQPNDWLRQRDAAANGLVASRMSVFKDSVGSATAPRSRRLSKNVLDAVEIAEQIVTSLMPLLDALQDVAAGSELRPGSQARTCVQTAVKTLPDQLNRLLDATGPSQSAPSSTRRLSRQSSRGSSSRGRSTALLEPPSSTSKRPMSAEANGYQAFDEEMDATELRLRQERERQERIKRRDNIGRIPPNFNLLLSQGQQRGGKGSTHIDEEEAAFEEQEQQQLQQQQQQQQQDQVYADSLYTLASEFDEMELRLRQERERQERIKRRDNLGRVPPNFNLMLSQGQQRSNKSFDEQREQQEYQRMYEEQMRQEEEEEAAYQQQQQQQEDEDPYAGLDEQERRLRMEKERQEAIKRRVVTAFGRPPPNFRLMSSAGGHQSSQQPESPRQTEESSGRVSRRLSSTELSTMSWKEQLKYKKTLKAEEDRSTIDEEMRNEQAKWENMPKWKAALLQDMQRKKWEAEAPMREAQRRERERQERFNSLPKWKQDLLLKKQMN
eukprot:m.176265 g.176265  ORF g.176265 m.176265 type:complete len:500 (+) comp16559_c0_seq2:304-1803(+)